MALNMELFKKLEARFRRMRHPQHFNMRTVAEHTECGAAMCLIGHILDLEGYKMKLKDAVNRDGIFDYEFISPKGRKVAQPIDTARRLAGLRDNELFYEYGLTTPDQAAARMQEIISTGGV